MGFALVKLAEQAAETGAKGLLEAHKGLQNQGSSFCTQH